MKKIVALVCALALAGCTQTLNESIQKAGPATCEAVTTVHTAYVTSEVGSERDRAIVEGAWNAITPLCDRASTITASDLVILAAQVAVVYKYAKKAKSNG